MKRAIFLIGLLTAALGLRAGESTKWVLATSSLTYHVAHTLHTSEGTSAQSRGKGVCDDSGCRFLVAAPVGSFLSGDHNRDLHMIETTRGAKFPLVTVNVAMASFPRGSDFTADLDVQFAGEKGRFEKVPFHVVRATDGEIHFTGVLPLKIGDFKIPAPSLFGMPIKNDVPIDVDMVWKKG